MPVSGLKRRQAQASNTRIVSAEATMEASRSETRLTPKVCIDSASSQTFKGGLELE